MALYWVQVAIWQQRSSALHGEMTSYPLAAEACWDFLPKKQPSVLKEGQSSKGAEILILSQSQIFCTREKEAKNYFYETAQFVGQLFFSRVRCHWYFCLPEALCQLQRLCIPGQPPHTKEAKQNMLGSSSLGEGWLMLPVSGLDQCSCDLVARMLSLP